MFLKPEIFPNLKKIPLEFITENVNEILKTIENTEKLKQEIKKTDIRLLTEQMVKYPAFFNYIYNKLFFKKKKKKKSIA